MIKLQIEANDINELHNLMRSMLSPEDVYKESLSPSILPVSKLVEDIAPPVMSEENKAIVQEQLAPTIPTPEEIAAAEKIERDKYISDHPIEPPLNHDDEGRILDKDGFTWDKRIHSSGKSLTAVGVWKVLRRPKALFDTDEKWKAYIADIRNVVTPGEELIAPAVPPLTEEQPLIIVTPVEDIPTPVTDPLTPITDFNEFINFITNGPCPIEYDAVLEIARKYGMQTSVIEFGQPDMLSKIPQIYNEIMGIS